MVGIKKRKDKVEEAKMGQWFVAIVRILIEPWSHWYMNAYIKKEKIRLADESYRAGLFL